MSPKLPVGAVKKRIGESEGLKVEGRRSEDDSDDNREAHERFEESSFPLASFREFGGCSILIIGWVPFSAILMR